VFDFNGTLLNRLVTNGALNSPGASPSRRPAGCIRRSCPGLATSGDGRINAYDARAVFSWSLAGFHSTPIAIPASGQFVFGGMAHAATPTRSTTRQAFQNGSTVKRASSAASAPPPRSPRSSNAAGGQTSGIAPGEIVAIAGQTVGPAPLVSATFPTTGSVTHNTGHHQRDLNNIPAPIFHTAGTQTSVIVP